VEQAPRPEDHSEEGLSTESDDATVPAATNADGPSRHHQHATAQDDDQTASPAQRRPEIVAPLAVDPVGTQGETGAAAAPPPDGPRARREARPGGAESVGSATAVTDVVTLDSPATSPIATMTAVEPATTTEAALERREESEPSAHGPEEPPDPWWRTVLVCVLLAVITGCLVGFTIDRSTRFSALDEATHIDYVWDIAHGTLPAKGDKLSAWTLSEWSCRGQANLDNLPACGSPAPAKHFPGSGLQYNYGHTPLYYAVNAGIALALTAITPVGFFDASRIGSGLWLLAGLIMLYLALRHWRVRWSIALPATITVAALPVVLHAATITTNDAPAVLCGALAAYLLARAVKYGHYGYWLPAVITAAAAATKILNALPMLALAGFFLLVGIDRWRRSGWRAGWPALRLMLAYVLPVGLVYVGWRGLQSLRGVAHFVNPIAGVNTGRLVGTPIREWLSTEFDGFTLADNYYLDPKVNSVYIPIWMDVIVLLLTAASFVAVLMFRKGTPQRAAGWALMIGCLLVPFVVQLQTYVSSDGSRYFPLVTTRYGMSLIPLAILCLALAVEARRIRLLTWLTPAAGIAAMAVGIAGIAPK
jgi:hypothetical protein